MGEIDNTPPPQKHVTGDEIIFRERLQAIIDWADLALKNRAEFDSHGVSNLDGPIFDAAREALVTSHCVTSKFERVQRNVGHLLGLMERRPTDRHKLTYTNYRRETSERELHLVRIWFGATDWHPEPQLLLKAFDYEKDAYRDFAVIDFEIEADTPSPQTREEDN